MANFKVNGLNINALKDKQKPSTLISNMNKKINYRVLGDIPTNKKYSDTDFNVVIDNVMIIYNYVVDASGKLNTIRNNNIIMRDILNSLNT